MKIENIPKHVKVGYKDYRIEFAPVGAVIAGGLYGECRHAEGVIVIAPGIDAKETANTLLHEILHAVWRCFNIPRGKAGILDDVLNEEIAVGGTANGLCAVMRDNPEVFNWIAGVLYDAKA